MTHDKCQDANSIGDLIQLIASLRGDGGCPWDRQQTPETIAIYLIEEVYELLHAIESNDSNAIFEELGDVLFQLLFITALFQEKGRFSLSEVVQFNRDKMIRRHPHVFGGESIETASGVKKRWHEIKLTEKRGRPDSLLDSVPPKMPALLRAHQISERAGKAGFDWENVDGVLEKVREELTEFESEVKGKKPDQIDTKKASLEFGDILFALVNVARFVNIHPESALMGSTRKFEKRFRKMESLSREQGLSLESHSMTQLEKMWQRAKTAE
jgi:tetrapyrrole methylase family protein/MazG family protein